MAALYSGSTEHSLSVATTGTNIVSTSRVISLLRCCIRPELFIFWNNYEIVSKNLDGVLKLSTWICQMEIAKFNTNNE